MAGTAVETGQATGGQLLFASTFLGIINALTESDEPVRAPLPATVTQPQRAGLIAGMSIGTLALIGLGIYAIVKLAK